MGKWGNGELALFFVMSSRRIGVRFCSVKRAKRTRSCAFRRSYGECIYIYEAAGMRDSRFRHRFSGRGRRRPHRAPHRAPRLSRVAVGQ